MGDSTTNLIQQHQWLKHAAAFLMLFSASSVITIPIGGVEFPQGGISFADAVVIYDPAIPVPAAIWLFESGLIGLIGITRLKHS